MTTVVVPRIAGAVAYDPTSVGITGGTEQLDNGAVATPSFAGTLSPTAGIYWRQSPTRMHFVASSTDVCCVKSNQMDFASGSTLSWSNAATPGGTSDVTLTRQAAGVLCLNNGTATPAGGSAAMALVFGSTAGFGVYIGSGVPTASAAQGSLYLRSDGSSTSTRMYVNTNGTTGWTAVTTAT